MLVVKINRERPCLDRDLQLLLASDLKLRYFIATYDAAKLVRTPSAFNTNSTISIP